MICYGKRKVPRKDFGEMSTSSVELHLNVFVFPDIKMFTAISGELLDMKEKTVSFAPLSF